MSSSASSDEDWHTDDEDNKEDDLAPEIDVFSRVGLPGHGLLGGKPLTRAEKIAMDPLEKFRVAVDAISRQLNSWEGITIREDSIAAMIESAAALEAVEHKNPTAYILGFLATGGGRRIDQTELAKVLKTILPRAESGNVQPPDVIRYARLWEKKL